MILMSRSIYSKQNIFLKMASVELSKQILPLDLVPILPKPKTIDAKG
jgi:hypothetical protein